VLLARAMLLQRNPIPYLRNQQAPVRQEAKAVLLGSISTRCAFRLHAHSFSICGGDLFS